MSSALHVHVRGPRPKDPAELNTGRVSLGHTRMLELLAFVVPALSFVEYTLVGQLIVTEVAMVALLPWLYRARQRRLVPRWFLGLGLTWLAFQIASDIAVGSLPEDFTRGWAAIVFTLTDVLAVAVLAGTQHRARLFAVGLSAAGFLGYFLSPHPYADIDPWKWAFAAPTTYLLAAALAGPRASRHSIGRAAVVGLLGIVHVGLGFRSLGGVCLVAGAYVVLTSLPRRARSRRGLVARPAMVALALTVSGVGALQLYFAAASEGVLGYDAYVKYQSQSGALGVLVGGRPELLASLQAIEDSPILGHGSWAQDGAYADVLADRLALLGYEPAAARSYVAEELIPAHSYLFGSWVWAGIAGGAFWTAVAVLVVRTMARGALSRTYLLPLMAFTSVQLLWNIAFSPYGSTQRIGAAFAIALCLVATNSGSRAENGIRHQPVATGATGAKLRGRRT